MTQLFLNCRLFFVPAAALTLLCASAPAAVLITVDISNPAAVTFTSTTGRPLVDDASTTTEDGATLLEFFTSTDLSGLDSPIGGNLRKRGELRYNTAFVDDASGSGVDLNFYRDGGTATQEFLTTQRAFRGSTTLDFTGFEYLLPALGTTGDIIAGWSGNLGPVIGEWTVVPEVSTYVQAGVMGLALTAWLVWRRRGMTAVAPQG